MGSAGAFSGRKRPCNSGAGPALRPAGADAWSHGAGLSPAAPDDPHVNPGCHGPPRPLTAEKGRRAQQGSGRHCGRTGARREHRARAPARAVAKGQLRMEVASGGS